MRLPADEVFCSGVALSAVLLFWAGLFWPTRKRTSTVLSVLSVVTALGMVLWLVFT